MKPRPTSSDSDPVQPPQNPAGMTAAGTGAPRAPLTLALAGNPNCGKTALFNALTGIRQTTGNWPGVTVERKEGRCELDGRLARFVDLPGIYSLDATSIDEEIARAYLLSREADLIVNVVDACNLERNLYLTVQLLEMGVPIAIALNMMDVARKRGIQIDAAELARELGCPVVPVVAVSREGIAELSARVLAVAGGRETGGFGLAHDEPVEQAIAELAPEFVPDTGTVADAPDANARWLALKLLEGDRLTEARTTPGQRERAARWRAAIAERTGEAADLQIADTRFSHAHALAARVVRQQQRSGAHLSDVIDRAVLSRVWGIPLFLAAMYLMFVFTINIGGAFIDAFDGVANALFVEGLGVLLGQAGAPDWLRLVLADGIGGGLVVVATFIPVIASLYLFLSALEDSGYMARAAFVMDRFMRSIGLPGKAFVPLIVGFGCNVPAVMATRTLENERERKLTILMNPFMSCGARLPVYVLFAAAFFPHSGQNLVFALYLTGIAAALLTGLAMKRTLLAGASTGFMMELPPYHLPTPRGVLLRTWDRIKLFLREAGKIIVVMVLALNLLSSIGTDGRFHEADSENSILSAASRALTPLFAPMGIAEDNWPAVLGIVSGVLAKEVIVGTLDTLYGRLAAEDAAAAALADAGASLPPDGQRAALAGSASDAGLPGAASPTPIPVDPASPPETTATATDAAETFDLAAALTAALATVPENLSGALGSLGDPLGLGVGDLADLEEVAAEQEVSTGTFGAMAERFDGQAGAFAYLLFVLLYFPCVATIGAIVREAGAAWAAFVAAWTTGIAWLAATAFYQAAIFARDPWTSGGWLLGLTLVLIAVLAGLRHWANRDRRAAASPAAEAIRC